MAPIVLAQVQPVLTNDPLLKRTDSLQRAENTDFDIELWEFLDLQRRCPKILKGRGLRMRAGDEGRAGYERTDLGYLFWRPSRKILQAWGACQLNPPRVNNL